MNWFSALRSLEFTSPFILLAAFVFLAILVAFSMYGPVFRGGNSTKRSVGSIPVADAERSASSAGSRNIKTAKITRFVSLVTLAALFAALLAGPTADSSEIQSTQEDVFDVSTALVVFDISGSVRGRVFEAGRNFTVYFLEHQEENMQGNTRIGLSFYSAFYPNELFMYRTPTFDLESLAYDTRRISLNRISNPELGDSRFFRLPGGTNTVAALREAADTLKDMEDRDEDLEGLTIILIVDIHPEGRNNLRESIEILADTIDEITESGINVYVASITVASRSERIIGELRSHLDANPRAKVFDILRIRSDEELEEVATAVADMETSRFTSSGIVALPNESGINTELIRTAFFAALIFVLFSELFFRTARGYSASAQKERKKQ